MEVTFERDGGVAHPRYCDRDHSLHLSDLRGEARCRAVARSSKARGEGTGM
jgi:hypothetical protein